MFSTLQKVREFCHSMRKRKAVQRILLQIDSNDSMRPVTLMRPDQTEQVTHFLHPLKMTGLGELPINKLLHSFTVKTLILLVLIFITLQCVRKVAVHLGYGRYIWLSVKKLPLKCAAVSLYSVVKQRLKCNTAKVCNCLIQFLLTIIPSIYFQHLFVSAQRLCEHTVYIYICMFFMLLF
jgi:hypothetical protein